MKNTSLYTKCISSAANRDEESKVKLEKRRRRGMKE